MKFIANQLNFCDYCKVDATNASSRLTENVCPCCNKYYCSACMPDNYRHDSHIPAAVRPTACKHCYATITEACYRDSGCTAPNAWPKFSRKDLRATGSSSAIALGEVLAFVLEKHIEEARREALLTFKKLYQSSAKFLKTKLKP